MSTNNPKFLIFCKLKKVSLDCVFNLFDPRLDNEFTLAAVGTHKLK